MPSHGNGRFKKYHGSGSRHGSGHNGHTPDSPDTSIFSRFETVQLSTEERLLLHAARLGDIGIIRDLLEDEELYAKININCMDYMGRNALFLAVDSDNLAAIEILMEKVNWDCIEEALLHAISKGARDIVQIVVDHPRYLSREHHLQESAKPDPFFRTEEKYQYPPDITPLILSAHKNDHELIQLFLSRGCTIEKPHAIDCQCDDCLMKQQVDSLRRSRSRLNRYKALASPAYMALSNPDPITATFELRQEMKQVAQVEKEFLNEYLSLAQQCMEFACELMDLCRGTQEVEAVLGEENTGAKDPLARLKMAIQYEEKKFVAHPNCQQHLTNIWFGKEMGFLLTLPTLQKLGITLLGFPALPFICVLYMVHPSSKFVAALKSPVVKFMTHTISHFTFLVLLTMATFGLENVMDIQRPGFKVDQNDLMTLLRPLRTVITDVQYLIMLWVIGLLWVECKQVYFSGGFREHFMQQYYNFMDFSILALYLASYTLRLVAHYRVHLADVYFNATERAKEALATGNSEQLWTLINETRKPGNEMHRYFMHASRFHWSSLDPEIVSEILFAVANVMSFARTTYVMPAHELLGPLQISLGKMLGDIMRFIVLFVLVLVAFMVGMTNLYRYYGSHTGLNNQNSSGTFKGLPQTVHTLFFSIFGLIPLDALRIDRPPNNDTYIEDLPYSTGLVDRVGLIMFAIYQIVVTIVLVNILIAMMSHSFEEIQYDSDVEWKFARTKLWMDYIDEGATLPVPFNILPSRKSFKYAFMLVRDVFKEMFMGEHEELQKIHYDFSRRRGNICLPDPDTIHYLINRRTIYSEIIQRLVRRYLFKVEREKIEDAAGLHGDDDFDSDDPTPIVDSEYDTTDLDDLHDDAKVALIPDDATSNVSMKSTRSMKSNVSFKENPVKQLSIIDENKLKRSHLTVEEPVKVTIEVDDTSSIPDTTDHTNLLSNNSVEHSLLRSVSQPTPSVLMNNSAALTSPKRRSSADVGCRLPKSFSTEAIRQITRRATIKRRTSRRRPSSQRRHNSADGTSSQLDVIERHQRLLDARLQDLQTKGKDDLMVRESLHVLRCSVGESERSLRTMATSIESMQDEMRNVCLTIGCRRTMSTNSTHHRNSVRFPFGRRQSMAASPRRRKKSEGSLGPTTV